MAKGIVERLNTVLLKYSLQFNIVVKFRGLYQGHAWYWDITVQLKDRIEP